MIKLWLENIRWLLNHPPIGLTDIKPEDRCQCDYCNGRANWQLDNLHICFSCMKRAFDKLLKEG